jgi:uncharacterized protein YgiM (DUF1202 family)
MRNLMPKLLFYYCAITAFLITVSTVFTSQTIGPVIFATLFLPVAAYFVIEFFKQLRSMFSPKPLEDSDVSSGPRKGEFFLITFIFLLLLSLGIWNIYNSTGASAQTEPEPTSSPLTFKVDPSPTPGITVTISITDGSELINIREKATVYSEKIAEAKDGDTFEYVSKDAGWYEVKLPSGSNGFISAKYVKEETK